MRRRDDPRQIAKLVEVQHIRRATAEIALNIARDEEAQAFATETAATEQAHAAQDDWFGVMAEDGFSPEFARALAGRLVVRERARVEAAQDCRAAAEDHAARQQDWRLSEALVRLTETSLTRARRQAARDRDEKRLGELSDRITFGWTRA